MSENNSERKFSLIQVGKNLATAVGATAEAVARTAAATTALITDNDLRKKGATRVTDGLRHGVQAVQSGPRQLQAVLQRLQKQAEDARRIALLERQRDGAVDIFIGTQLFEDAPQELRSRLWMAILENPDLSQRHINLCCSDSTTTIASDDQQHKEEEDGHTDDSDDNNNNDVTITITPPPPTAAHHGPQPHYNGNDDDHHYTTNRKSINSPKQSKDGDDWEVLPVAQRCQGQHLLLAATLHRNNNNNNRSASPEGPTTSSSLPSTAAAAAAAAQWRADREELRNTLMAAMASVSWPLPEDPLPDSRYSTLLQISIGQEDVDDIISRDCHRTFPEHPMFGFKHGQNTLFRVLKAYSLQDLEVGYCQGMAFLVGLLLFYVPEEPAFQLFCSLMGGEGGPDLRRMYLPGLEGLKKELWKLDWLMQRHLPNLKHHLQQHSVVPVLYASQWLLTCFSCPFPINFSCQLVDVMLMEHSDAVLLRCALCVLAECESELIMQDDFEEMLTYLKVTPLKWDQHRQRRVISAAVNSPITHKELAEAEEAAKMAASEVEREVLNTGDGRGGMMKRETLAVDKQKKEKEEVESSDTAATAGIHTTASESNINRCIAVEEEEGQSIQMDTAVAPPIPILLNVEGQLAAHQAALDEDMLTMVMELENMWSEEGLLPGESTFSGGGGNDADDREPKKKDEEGS
jgi:hypothetical protein